MDQFLHYTVNLTPYKNTTAPANKFGIRVACDFIIKLATYTAVTLDSTVHVFIRIVT
jgi:hypothetical protein